ncbi:MAG TPA: hypothetical protein VLA16_14465, partial [Ideonella sp.]|nr:hypothetical protein [Ideonella sp.]
LPKEFRFHSKTVEIFRRGDEIVLREKTSNLGDLIKHLPLLTDEEHPSDIADAPPETLPSWDDVK